MVRREWLGWLAIVVVLGVGANARAEDQKAKLDMTGEWRLDAQHSDTPQRPPGGGGGWGGGGWGGHSGGWGGGHGGWGGGGGHGGRPPGAESGPPDPSRRPVRLPDLIHVTETPTLVSFEDSTGAVLEEVATVSAEADTFARAPNAPHFMGTWKGDKLVIERSSDRGKITETISLEDKGTRLVFHTKVESNGEMPSREFKRQYRKVTSSS